MILYMIINMATGASPTTWNGCLIHIPTYFGSDVPRPRRHDYCQELLHSWPWSEKTLGDALSWVPGVKPLDMARAEFKNIRDVLENTHEGLVVWGWWVQNPHHIWVYYPFPRKFKHPLNETIVFCWEIPHSIGTIYGVFNIRVMGLCVYIYKWYHYCFYIVFFYRYYFIYSNHLEAEADQFFWPPNFCPLTNHGSLGGGTTKRKTLLTCLSCTLLEVKDFYIMFPSMIKMWVHR